MRKIAVYTGKKGISGEQVALALIAMKFPFAMVTQEEIIAGELASYPAVIFPGGHSIRISKKGIAEVLKFVDDGGGYLGICAGCQFGAAIQILPVHLVPFRAQGIFCMRVIKRHPVTRGYKRVPEVPKARKPGYTPEGRVRVLYGNGGLLEAGDGVDVLVSCDGEDRFGGIVAGERGRGRGRVVLSAPHPEATPPAKSDHPWAKVEPDLQDPRNLLANAVRWITRGQVRPAVR